MKKVNIALLLLMLVIIGIIITTLNQAPSYANFGEAKAKPNTEFHVIGSQSKEEGVVYNPVVNPDEFTFYLLDKKGGKEKVVLKKSKPQDFEKAEQIVIIGKYKGNYFEASSILMKCPSKYSDNKKKDEWSES